MSWAEKCIKKKIVIIILINSWYTYFNNVIFSIFSVVFLSVHEKYRNSYTSKILLYRVSLGIISRFIIFAFKSNIKIIHYSIRGSKGRSNSTICTWWWFNKKKIVYINSITIINYENIPVTKYSSFITLNFVNRFCLLWHVNPVFICK